MPPHPLAEESLALVTQQCEGQVQQCGVQVQQSLWWGFQAQSRRTACGVVFVQRRCGLHVVFV